MKCAVGITVSKADTVPVIAYIQNNPYVSKAYLVEGSTDERNVTLLVWLQYISQVAYTAFEAQVSELPGYVSIFRGSVEEISITADYQITHLTDPEALSEFLQDQGRSWVFPSPDEIAQNEYGALVTWYILHGLNMPVARALAQKGTTPQDLKLHTAEKILSDHELDRSWLPFIDVFRAHLSALV